VLLRLCAGDPPEQRLHVVVGEHRARSCLDRGPERALVLRSDPGSSRSRSSCSVMTARSASSTPPSSSRFSSSMIRASRLAQGNAAPHPSQKSWLRSGRGRLRTDSDGDGRIFGLASPSRLCGGRSSRHSSSTLDPAAPEPQAERRNDCGRRLAGAQDGRVLSSPVGR
jgi:hypothetical protein